MNTRDNTALSESSKKVTVLTEKVKSIDDLKDVLEATDKAALDAKQVIELINRRVFQRNRKQRLNCSCHVTMFAVMKMARMLSSLSMQPKVKE